MSVHDFKSCPACGAGLKEHSPETDLCYETWRFYCDGVIMKMENEKLTAEEPCENALRFALINLMGGCELSCRRWKAGQP
jgi:hypothetical protein